MDELDHAICELEWLVWKFKRFITSPLNGMCK